MEMKQSAFSRTLANEEKMGAYYTNTDHAGRLGKMFEFSGASFVLEPSIGDGTAVKAFLENAKGKENATLFGVELNSDVAVATKQTIPNTICGDFVEGVEIANKVFSLVFANPPYGTTVASARLETLFIKKIFQYMMPGGYAVLILPIQLFSDRSFMELFLRRFECVQIYRFDEGEYEKFHQYAVIAKSLRFVVPTIKEGAYQMFLNLENAPHIPVLSEIDEPIYTVEPTKKKTVSPFRGKEFSPDMVREELSKSSLYRRISNITRDVVYAPVEFNNPPTELSSEMLCLAAVSGVGAGLAGNEDEGTLHLQKGIVKMEETDEPVYNEKGEVYKAIHTTFQKTSFNILDNDGNFSSLE